MARVPIMPVDDGFIVEGEHFVSRLAAVEHARYLETLRSGDGIEVLEASLELRMKLFNKRAERAYR